MALSFSDAKNSDVGCPRSVDPSSQSELLSGAGLIYNASTRHISRYAHFQNYVVQHTRSFIAKDLLPHKDHRHDRRDQTVEWRNSNRTPETRKRSIQCYNSSSKHGHWHCCTYYASHIQEQQRWNPSRCFLHDYNSYFRSPLPPIITSHTQQTLQQSPAKWPHSCSCNCDYRTSTTNICTEKWRS